MEKLNANIVALSLGITSTVLYILCLIAVAITPVQTMTSFVNNLQHSIDFSGIIVKDITFVGSIIGIVGWFIIAAVTGYIFAIAYNWIGEKL